MGLKQAALAAAACLLSACATAGGGETAAPARDPNDIYDPWEGWNRRMFALNNAIDRAVLEPTALGYRAVTTRQFRRSARNFFANLSSPMVFANDLLQLEFKRSGVTLGRFAMNSTLGVGGLFDPADDVGLQRHGEDFGQTLATYGVPPGPYLVVPLLGPTTLRDGPAAVVDNLFDPATYILTPAANYYRLSRTGGNVVTLREQFQDPLQDLRNNSLDFYTSYQSFYWQARRNAILNGRQDLDALPDLDDFDDFEDFEDFEDFDDAEAPDAPRDDADRT